MRRLALAASLSLTAACGGSTPAAAPTVAITSPAAGSTVALGTDVDKTVKIAFTTTGWAFEPCGNNTSCGHLHLLIDGTDCGTPYNNPVTSSDPGDALFAKCARPTGQHTVKLELHHPDHSALTDSTGATISSSVTFTTQ
jgi:hypothetical protein